MNMGMDTATLDIRRLLANQRNFFDSGQTKDTAFRKKALQTLYAILRDNEKKVLDALEQDLSKSAYEGYMTELGLTLEKIRSAQKKHP